MTARTSSDAVKLIFKVKDMEDAYIMSMIQTANLVVTEELVGQGLSDDRLDMIELWLAAHYCAIRDQRHQSVVVDGRTTQSFQGKTGMGLDLSFYGQTVKSLDTSGILAEADAGLKRASIEMIDKVD